LRKETSGISIKPLVVFGITAFVAAVAASPYFIVVPRDVIYDAYMALVRAGQIGFDGWRIDSIDNGYLFYLKTLWWGIGSGLLLVSIIGVVCGVFRHEPEDLVLLSFPVVYFLIAGHQVQYYFARFIIPIIPVLLIIAAILLHDVVIRLTQYQPSQTALLFLGSLLLTVAPLANIIRFDYLLTQTDTRTLAKEWIEENIPAGARIAVEWPFFGPPLATKTKNFPRSVQVYDVETIDRFGVGDYPYQWYEAQGFNYVITSSFISDLELMDPDRNLTRRRNYESLPLLGTVLHRVQAYDSESDASFVFDEIYGPAISLWQRERPGPTVRIYKVKWANAPELPDLQTHWKPHNNGLTYCKTAYTSDFCPVFSPRRLWGPD
jgi:hypothetical protein